MKLSASQKLNIRQHARDAVKALGVADPSMYDAPARSWDDLCKHHRSLLSSARSLMAKVNDDTDGDVASAIEDAFNTLTALADEIDEERDMRNSLGSKSARLSPRGRRPEVDDVDPGFPEDFDNGGERSNLLTPEMRFSDWMRSSGAITEERGLPSLGAYLRSIHLGAKTEAERRALMEGSNSAGGYTVPTALSSELIDLMRAKSIVNRVGAVTIPLTSNKNMIAKVVGTPEPQFRGEGELVTESGLTFDAVTFVPKSVAVIVRVTRELLEDSLNIGAELPNILAKAMAEKLDRAAIMGSGVGSEPRGVRNFPGLTPARAFAANLEDQNFGLFSDYRPFIAAHTALRRVNADTTAYVMGVDLEGYVASLTDNNGQPLQPPKLIANIPMYSTTMIESRTDLAENVVIAGDWSKLMIGMRHDLTIQVLDQRYVDTLEVGFICHMRFDVAATHEQAFSVMNLLPAGWYDEDGAGA